MPNNSNDTVPQPAILPAEYDFHSVPKKEWKDCVYYEYARESKAIISEVRQLRCQLQAEWKRRGAKIGDHLKMTATCTALRTDPEEAICETDKLAQLALSAGFPKKPWQALSAADKMVLTGFLDRAIFRHNERLFRNFPPFHIATFSGDSSLGEMTLNTWRKKSTPERLKHAPAAMVEKSLISGFFRLDTRYSRQVLIKQFAEWLSANHLSREHKAAKGRHSDSDALNQLGALRLRCACSRDEAVSLIASLIKAPNGIRYGDHKAWNRACDTAVSRFRNLFLLPDTALPIHYTTGWRK